MCLTISEIEVYGKMLSWMKRNKVNTFPLDVTALISRMGIRLLPMSEIMRASGLTAQEIFAVWGNRDGVTYAHNRPYPHDTEYVIAYNDDMPHVRRRFTMCEELAHIILGHLNDEDFNAFSQEYDSEKYERCESEAKLGASILLCPPKLVLACDFLSADDLTRVCRISRPCAERTYNNYTEHRADIERLVLYRLSLYPTSKVDLWQFKRKAKLAKSG